MADGEETDLDRRDLIKLGAAATLAASLGVSEPLAAQSPAPATPVAATQTFLTP